MTGKESFKKTIQEQHGFTQKESERIYNIYFDLEVAKFDSLGRFTVKHGAFMEKKIMLKALANG